MKKYIYYITGLFLVTILFASCEDDFLQRVPQTSITKENFFNSPADLETYVNGIYNAMLNGGSYDDISSDNTSTYIASSELVNMLRGNLSASTVSGWSDWSNLRTVNFLLENAGKATGDQAAINHHIGVARYFRAQLYIGMVKRYSDVPWYNKALETTDPDLYKAADPRALVVDSIMGDLEFAVANIKADLGQKTKIHKYAALSLLSRFCLYEGTYRKYHAELNLSADHKRFLERSVWACEQIMNSSNFEIVGSGAQGYQNLFISTTLNGNKEIIQWAQYTESLNRGNNSHTVLGYTWALSRNLMETYLMKDGTPFTQQSGYDKTVYLDMFKDRDPRFGETFVNPGYMQNTTGSPYYIKPTTGGYDQIKFYPRDASIRKGWNYNYTALPIFRYAETLLNYVEAKAELGTLTQDDIDKTINKIRARVQMPAMSLATVNAVMDPVLVAYYPNVSGANQGAILEIRRERRVELACEGLRYDDLSRWGMGQHFADSQQGMYWPALGAMDVSGDGVPDIALLASPTETGPIDGLPDDVKKGLALYYLKDDKGMKTSIYLSEGTSGYIGFTDDRDQGRAFKDPQYYYRPIPQQQVKLNPQLKQPFGWD